MCNPGYEVFVAIHSQEIADRKNRIQIDLSRTSIEAIKIDFLKCTRGRIWISRKKAESI